MFFIAFVAQLFLLSLFTSNMPLVMMAAIYSNKKNEAWRQGDKEGEGEDIVEEKVVFMFILKGSK